MSHSIWRTSGARYCEGEHRWTETSHCPNLKYCDDPFCYAECLECPYTYAYCEDGELFE